MAARAPRLIPKAADQRGSATFRRSRRGLDYLSDRSLTRSPAAPRHPRAHLRLLPIPHLARARLAFVRAAHDGGGVFLGGKAEFLGLKAAGFVAQAASFLELEVRRGLAHFLF